MRWVWSILSTLVLATLIVAVLFFINPAFFVSHILSSKVGMPVRIEKAYIGTQEITMDGLTISNPRGFSEQPALGIQSIDIVAPLSNYFDAIVKIQKVDIDEVVLRLEFPGASNAKSNWNQLMAESKKSSPPPSDKDNYAIIGTLTIRHITVEIYHGGRKTSTQTLKDLSFTNLKTTKEDISRQITQLVLRQLFNNLKGLIDFPLNAGQNAAKDLLQPLEKLNPFK